MLPPLSDRPRNVVDVVRSVAAGVYKVRLAEQRDAENASWKAVAVVEPDAASFESMRATLTTAGVLSTVQNRLLGWKRACSAVHGRHLVLLTNGARRRRPTARGAALSPDALLVDSHGRPRCVDASSGLTLQRLQLWFLARGFCEYACETIACVLQSYLTNSAALSMPCEVDGEKCVLLLKSVQVFYCTTSVAYNCLLWSSTDLFRCPKEVLSIPDENVSVANHCVLRFTLADGDAEHHVWCDPAFRYVDADYPLAGNLCKDCVRFYCASTMRENRRYTMLTPKPRLLAEPTSSEVEPMVVGLWNAVRDYDAGRVTHSECIRAIVNWTDTVEQFATGNFDWDTAYDIVESLRPSNQNVPRIFPTSSPLK